MLSLTQLTSSVTKDQALQLVLDELTSLGYAATSWQSGSIQYTLIQMLAQAISDFSVLQARYNKGYFPSLAEKEFQDLLGTYVYGIPRNPAVSTLGKMVLTSSAAAPLHTWGVGELIIADQSTAPAQTYLVQEAGSLSPGDSLEVAVEAQVGGGAGNIPANITLYMWTPLVGVEATNPPITDPVTGVLSTSWITTYGADEESLARFAERMQLRWAATVSPGTADGYKALALEALPAMTRCDVREGVTAGSVLITGATVDDGLTGDEISTIEDYFDGSYDGKVRRMLNDTLYVQSAAVLTTPALTLDVSVDSVFANDAASRITEALRNLFGDLPIGGEVIAPSTVGKIYQSRMIEEIMAQKGVRRVSGVPADITLLSTQIYVPTITITVVRT
jgi:uncharacterized phage protein gp47/JayE